MAGSQVPSPFPFALWVNPSETENTNRPLATPPQLKGQGVASWPATSGATLRILRLFLAPARQTWSIWWSLAILSSPGVQYGHHYSRLHPTTSEHWHGAVGPTWCATLVLDPTSWRPKESHADQQITQPECSHCCRQLRPRIRPHGRIQRGVLQTLASGEGC